MRFLLVLFSFLVPNQSWSADCGPTNEALEALLSCTARLQGMQNNSQDFSDVFGTGEQKLVTPVRHYSVSCSEGETWDREQSQFYISFNKVQFIDGLVLGTRSGDQVRVFSLRRSGPSGKQCISIQKGDFNSGATSVPLRKIGCRSGEGNMITVSVPSLSDKSNGNSDTIDDPVFSQPVIEQTDSDYSMEEVASGRGDGKISQYEGVRNEIWSQLLPSIKKVRDHLKNDREFWQDDLKRSYLIRLVEACFRKPGLLGVGESNQAGEEFKDIVTSLQNILPPPEGMMKAPDGSWQKIEWP